VILDHFVSKPTWRFAERNLLFWSTDCEASTGIQFRFFSALFGYRQTHGFSALKKSTRLSANRSSIVPSPQRPSGLFLSQRS
jgi:hypothetical protein